MLLNLTIQIHAPCYLFRLRHGLRSDVPTGHRYGWLLLREATSVCDRGRGVRQRYRRVYIRAALSMVTGRL